MQVASRAKGQRRNFTVGIEACNRGVCAQYGLHGFDLLLGSLFEDEFTPDATDQDGQLRRSSPQSVQRDLGRAACAIDSRSKFAFMKRASKPCGTSPAKIRL